MSTWIQDPIPGLGEAEILAKNPALQGSDPGLEDLEPSEDHGRIYVLTPDEIAGITAYFDRR